MDSKKCSKAASPTDHQQESLQIKDQKLSCFSGAPRNYEMVAKIPRGWSNNEKFEFLQALKAHGSSKIDKIKKSIPKKSFREIKEMIDYYKTKAAQESMVQSKEERKEKDQDTTSQDPLSKWAQLITDSTGLEDLQTEIADAIHLIAETEMIPPPELTYNYDFREIYHTIANALEGKPLPRDENIIRVIETCLIESAKSSKKFMPSDVLNKVLKRIDLNNTVTNFSTGNDDLEILSDLASQISYNPLNIQEQYLRVQYDIKKEPEKECE